MALQGHSESLWSVGVSLGFLKYSGVIMKMEAFILMNFPSRWSSIDNCGNMFKLIEAGRDKIVAISQTIFSNAF